MYKFFSAAVLFAGLTAFFSQPVQADYVLEKVVEVSRHGVRPPSPDNRRAIENGSARRWPDWLTADGNLTGHGYTAAWLKGRYESSYYREAGLLGEGCPKERDFHLIASPMQRTRATAQVLAEAAFRAATLRHMSWRPRCFSFPTRKSARSRPRRIVRKRYARWAAAWQTRSGGCNRKSTR